MRAIEKVLPSSSVEQVALKLREWILRQGLMPGDRVPPYRELAGLLGVSYVTVKRGVDALVQSGVVKCVDRKGVFVANGMHRIRQSLDHALIIFPASLHHVLSHVYTSDMARGLLSSLEPAVQCHIRYISADGLVFGDDVDALNVDAVILPGVENDEYLRMAAKWGRPVVVLDYCSETVPLDFVACDNRAAARRCVDHLADRGHRRIALLPGAEIQSLPVKRSWDTPFILRASDARERRAGVWAAAAARGLPEPRAIQMTPAKGGGAAIQSVPTLEQTFRSRSDRPTALVLDTEMDAPGVIRRLAELGLRVPEDVSVCAVAGAGRMSDCPELTQSRFDFYRMGHKAVEILRERFARPAEPVNRIHRVGFEWVEGGSTREARA